MNSASDFDSDSDSFQLKINQTEYILLPWCRAWANADAASPSSNEDFKYQIHNRPVCAKLPYSQFWHGWGIESQVLRVAALKSQILHVKSLAFEMISWTSTLCQSWYVLTKLSVIPKIPLPLMNRIKYEGSQTILKASSPFFKHKNIEIYSNIQNGSKYERWRAAWQCQYFLEFWSSQTIGLTVPLYSH